MAISVNPQTFVITVPKADLTLVQSTPTEIYNLNVNTFRLWLKDWEDNGYENNNSGITFYVTHIHYPEVQLGGLTFARVVNILDPYTITFEDGQYAVNIIGGNSNIGDKTNVNQVSVRPQNSAGLISTPLIEFSSFENGVWYHDISGASGTLFPTGTRLQPSGNLSDAKDIATYRGFNNIYVMNEAIIGSSLDFSDFQFIGQNHVKNIVTIESSANVSGSVFKNLTITGTLDGNNEIEQCVIDDLDYVNGHIHNCGLLGTTYLAGSQDAILADCITIDPYDPPIIDMGGAGQNLAMPNYSGLLYLENLTGSNFAGIGLLGGTVYLNSSTVTGGTVHVSGTGTLRDELGNHIHSGTWNGGVTIVNELVNQGTVSEAVWEQAMIEYQTAGTFGAHVRRIRNQRV